MSQPIRIQLSRARGFNLQDASLAANGLPAINVARPTKWGNPVTKSDFDLVQSVLAGAGLPAMAGTWQDHAIRCYDGWIGGEISEMGDPPTVDEIVTTLRGKNLACWCDPDMPCHADVLLRLANITCEEIAK